MLFFLANLKLSAKIFLVGAVSVIVTAIALVCLAVWQSSRYNILADGEINLLIEDNLDNIMQGVFKLIEAQNETVQKQVNFNLNVADYILASAGGVKLSKETLRWNVANQLTGELSEIEIPKMGIGDYWLEPGLDPDEVPVVDEVSRLVGETITIYQRMNEHGDMLRVATSVRDSKGKRATGTFIPVIGPDGTPDPVISSVLQGRKYIGRAYVVNAWYLTAYEAIEDTKGEIVGMLYVGIRQQDVETRIRQAVLETRVGKTGYVYILSAKGDNRGHYVISQQGKRDGENLWDVRDSDNNLVVQSIIQKATALGPGQMATQHYRWQNPGEKSPRWKIARLAYYQPWEWVIGTSVCQDELQTYRSVLEQGRMTMSHTMIVAGMFITLLFGLIGGVIAWTIVRPIRQMTVAAEIIAKGDLEQSVSATSSDEIGSLGRAFNFMTDRLRQTLDVLRKSEEKYRVFFEKAPIPLWEEDFSLVREGFDLIRASGVSDFEEFFHDNPSAVEDYTKLVRIIDVNDRALRLFQAEDKNELMSSLSSVFAADSPRVFERELVALAQGKTEFECEMPLKTIKGEKIYTSLYLRVVPGFEESLARVLISGLDITGPKLAEERRVRLEEELRQAQRMETVGLLAGGVAHDFNNLLTPIIGYSEMLLSKARAGVSYMEQTHHLQQIKEAAQRAKDLTHRLLAFSRKEVIEPKTIELRRVVERFEELLQRIIRENIHVEVRLPESLGLVRADEAQLEQVLFNLSLNAQDAMPQGGMLVIEAVNIELGEEECISISSKAKAGKYVMLSVSDSGSGIDAYTMQHIFEPFFTTKEIGMGTGLGLSTVYGIVERHDGFISVYSEPGHGCLFKVYVPRGVEADTVRAVSPPPPSTALVGGNETILLVEDHEMVRALASSMLESLGYRVLVAEDSELCLKMVRSCEERIDLLLTDVVMPKMNGKELYEKLRSILPDLRVLFMSGYSRNVIGNQGVIAEDVPFLQKPFSLGMLAKKVRRVIES